MGINSLFSIAKSSLFAHQQALAVTSANLANANNPNYSRQVVSFGTLPPDNRANFSFGTGVAVNDIYRIRNSVTDVQIRNNNHSFYDAQKRASVLSDIESIFSEPSEFGLSNLLAEFYNSWDELAVEPGSLSLRTSVVQSAQNVVEKIDNIYSGINQRKLNTRSEAVDVAKTVNSLLEQVNTVNKQIYEASVVGNTSNDLADKRDQLLEELSQYVDMQVTIDKNDVANVAIGGVFAADGLHFKQFKVVEDNGKLSLVSENDEVPVSVKGGSLNALLDLYNKELPAQLKSLDDISIALMDEVNNLHKQGYTLTDPQETGVEFFTKYEYGKLEINADIIDDPYNIAISDDGSEGNNNIAIKIAELKNKSVLDGKTINESYSEFVSGVANEINLQNQNIESYGIVLNQLEQTKIEYSGVSTDEEMMNVMKYQKSYDAAAKLITVADDLLETLLTLV